MASLSNREFTLLMNALGKQDDKLEAIEKKVDHFHMCVEDVKVDIKVAKTTAKLTSWITGTAVAGIGLYLRFRHGLG